MFFGAPVRLSLSHKFNANQDNVSSPSSTSRQLVDVMLTCYRAHYVHVNTDVMSS